jgi:hypothetical protein
MGDGIGNLSQLLRALYEYGLVGVVGWMFDSYGVVRSLAVLMSFFGGGTSLVLFRRMRKKSKNRTSFRELHNPELLTLHKMLGRMDRRVKAAGLERHFTEPLHTFSEQVRQRDSGSGWWRRISDWYVEYANLRYCKEISTERVQKLRQLYKRLQD